MGSCTSTLPNEPFGCTQLWLFIILSPNSFRTINLGIETIPDSNPQNKSEGYSSWSNILMPPSKRFKYCLYESRIYTFKNIPDLLDLQKQWLNDYNARIRTEVGAELKNQMLIKGYRWMIERTKHIPMTSAGECGSGASIVNINLVLLSFFASFVTLSYSVE